MKLTPEQIQEIKKLYGEGVKVSFLAGQFGVSTITIYYHVGDKIKANRKVYHQTDKYKISNRAFHRFYYHKIRQELHQLREQMAKIKQQYPDLKIE